MIFTATRSFSCRSQHSSTRPKVPARGEAVRAGGVAGRQKVCEGEGGGRQNTLKGLSSSAKLCRSSEGATGARARRKRGRGAMGARLATGKAQAWRICGACARCPRRARLRAFAHLGQNLVYARGAHGRVSGVARRDTRGRRARGRRRDSRNQVLGATGQFTQAATRGDRAGTHSACAPSSRPARRPSGRPAVVRHVKRCYVSSGPSPTPRRRRPLGRIRLRRRVPCRLSAKAATAAAGGARSRWRGHWLTEAPPRLAPGCFPAYAAAPAGQREAPAASASARSTCSCAYLIFTCLVALAAALHACSCPPARLSAACGPLHHCTLG